MNRVLIVGAGGVSRVVVHKCAQHPEIFEEITLASRTLSKCDAIVADIKNYPRPIKTEQVDADRVDQLVALIEKVRPDLLINVALPYQDLTIMEACLQTGVHYMDTANYEHPDEAKFCYAPQWALQKRFEEAGLLALLGCGFDPGVTNVYTAYAKKHHFDKMNRVDIIDCNAGDHGYPFATNFNPEINIREVSAKGRFYKQGSWIETDPLSVKHVFDFPHSIGPKDIYLLYHEEMESLTKHYPEIQQMRFWMTFGQSYLTHLKVLENVGMTGIKPILFEGKEIVPLQFLKRLLPDPASLGPRTVGKTCIGIWVSGEKENRPKSYYLFNICDHQECYREVGAQAVSYTTGVPAALGAKLILTGAWSGKGVYNVEQFDPDPFMNEIGDWGLPWEETFPNCPTFEDALYPGTI
ncbi:MAG: saccharopine dehydrogenase family protein [Planctomycetia bacterium]|nr:saccharopine dehydrogenase family protein [Planctomycetia bacterium]